MPDTTVVKPDPIDTDDHCSDLLPNLDASADLIEFGEMDLSQRQPRHLQPGSISELNAHYSNNSGDSRASFSVFYRTYKRWWRPLLKFRVIGHHARCATCARLGEERHLASTKEEIAKVRVAHNAHIECVLKDREVYSRIQRLSAESCRAILGPPQLVASETVSSALWSTPWIRQSFACHETHISQKSSKSWRP